jgi:hypothetical protein
MTIDLQTQLDSRAVAALREVLELAVGHIAEQHRTPATKAKMAQTILSSARGGVTDRRALLSHAVEAGAEGAP